MPQVFLFFYHEQPESDLISCCVNGSNFPHNSMAQLEELFTLMTSGRFAKKVL